MSRFRTPLQAWKARVRARPALPPPLSERDLMLGTLGSTAVTHYNVGGEELHSIVLCAIRGRGISVPDDHTIYWEPHPEDGIRATVVVAKARA